MATEIKNELADLSKTAEHRVKYLRSKDVQKMLGIGSSTLQSLRINGLIPAYKLAGMWFYKEAEVINAVENGTKKGGMNEG